jgi:hypothetical protein
MADNHDIIVKVGLTADQYISFHNCAKSDDLKDAQLLRQLVLKHIREVSMIRLSAELHDLESAEMVLNGVNRD